MSATIIYSKDENLLKRFFEILAGGEFELIRDEADLEKNFSTQISLFSEKKNKQTFCLINLLQKNLEKKLANLEEQTEKNNLFFLQLIRGQRNYLPVFLKDKVKIIELDKMVKSFSFWQKIAKKIGTDISYSEWQKALTIVGSRVHFLFSVLEQKALAKKYDIDFLLGKWSEGNIFKLTDSLEEKNLAQFFYQLKIFWQSEEDPSRIFNYLINHFIKLGQISLGFNPKMHPYAFVQAKKSLNFYSSNELKGILNKLFSLDIKMKTGFFDNSFKTKEIIYSFVFWFLFSKEASVLSFLPLEI